MPYFRDILARSAAVPPCGAVGAPQESHAFGSETDAGCNASGLGAAKSGQRLENLRSDRAEMTRGGSAMERGMSAALGLVHYRSRLAVLRGSRCCAQ